MRKLLLAALIFFYGCKDDPASPSSAKAKQKPSSALTAIKQTFRYKIDSLLPAAKRFTKTNHYNEQYVFIADLSLHSGFDRFAVVDIKKDSIVHSGLVAHGAGGKYFSPTVKFSNTPNSLCSSPGKYKVGNKYDGRFGKAYKLHGLDKTNSKAFNRFIVLHAYDCVPDKMPYPDFVCNSEGCPMVSYHFLSVLSSYIDKSRKPILLWIIG